MAKVDTILSRIRGARYAGQIIFVEYPATNDNTFTGQLQAQIYQDLLPVLPKYGVGIAPVWDRFRIATQPYGGHSSTASLLITLADGTCNVHSRVGASVDRQHHRGDGTAAVELFAKVASCYSGVKVFHRVAKGHGRGHGLGEARSQSHAGQEERDGNPAVLRGGGSGRVYDARGALGAA